MTDLIRILSFAGVSIILWFFFYIFMPWVLKLIKHYSKMRG